MPNSFAPIPIATLLAQAGWARRLARALTNDADEADDVLQDTWIVASKFPPDERGPVRPWLATVLRRMASRHNRTKRARARREQEALAAEHFVSAETISLRVEAQRELALAVDQLAEPFRMTVLLHFYEGLSCAEISRAQNVPSGTVRWRVHKGLELLRTAMRQRESDGRQSWEALLMPLLPEAQNSPAWPSTSRIARGGKLRPRFVLPVLALGIAAAVSIVQLARQGDGAVAINPTSPTPNIARFANLPPSNPVISISPTCVGIPSLQSEVAKAESQAVKAMSPGALFAYFAESNATAQHALEPLIAAIMKGDFVEPEPYSLECRRWACRMSVLRRKPGDEQRTNAWMLPLQRAPDIVSRTSGITFTTGSDVRDPVSGELAGQGIVFIALARSDGKAAASESEKRVYVSSFPIVPPDACDSETGILQLRLQAVKEAVAKGADIKQRFEVFAPNAEMQRQVEHQLAAHLPEGTAQEPLVECRGTICKLVGAASGLSDDLGKSPWFGRHLESARFGCGGSFIELKGETQVRAETELVAALHELAQSVRLATACQRTDEPSAAFTISIQGTIAEGLAVTFHGAAVGSPYQSCAANLIQDAVDAFAKRNQGDLKISSWVPFVHPPVGARSSP